jgi:hypothetical protein
MGLLSDSLDNFIRNSGDARRFRNAEQSIEKYKCGRERVRIFLLEQPGFFQREV